MTAKRAKSRKGRSPDQALLVCLQQAQRLDTLDMRSSRRGDAERRVEWFRISQGGVRLAGDSVDAFKDVVDALEDDGRIGYEFSAKTIQERVKAFVLSALERNNWNITKAAEETGMLRPNFHALIKKLGISVRDHIEH